MVFGFGVLTLDRKRVSAHGNAFIYIGIKKLHSEQPLTVLHVMKFPIIIVCAIKCLLEKTDHGLFPPITFIYFYTKQAMHQYLIKIVNETGKRLLFDYCMIWY